MHLTQSLLLCAALLSATSALAPAADNTRGAVEQSGGNIVRQNPSLPQLHLSDAQRERIRQTLLIKHTEVEFRLKTTQSAKDFNPKIGAALPKGVKPDGLPSELTADPAACRLRLCENERPNSFGKCDDGKDRRHHSRNAAANERTEIARFRSRPTAVGYCENLTAEHSND